jgi:hypothetical protein
VQPIKTGSTGCMSRGITMGGSALHVLQPFCSPNCVQGWAASSVKNGSAAITPAVGQAGSWVIRTTRGVGTSSSPLSASPGTAAAPGRLENGRERCSGSVMNVEGAGKSTANSSTLPSTAGTGVIPAEPGRPHLLPMELPGKHATVL